MAVKTKRPLPQIRADIHAKNYAARQARKNDDATRYEMIHDRINILLDEWEEAK